MNQRDSNNAKLAEKAGVWSYKAGRRYPSTEYRYHICLYLHAMRIEAQERVDNLRRKVNGENGHYWANELTYWEHALTHITTRLKQGTKSINDRIYQLASMANMATPSMLELSTEE